ncbi:hypothetical protein, partial [Siminovitchia terrae]
MREKGVILNKVVRRRLFKFFGDTTDGGPIFHWRTGSSGVLSSLFNLIQQKSPTSISCEMNAYWYSTQWGFKPRLNKVKAS